MEIKYKNNKTKKLCTNLSFAKKDLGVVQSEKLFSTLNFIQNAATLEDVARFPPFRLHQLEGKRKDQLAIDLGKKSGYRLLIKPDPPFRPGEKHFDFYFKCSNVTSVIILEVSKHYE